jgi:hypothetical protein
VIGACATAAQRDAQALKGTVTTVNQQATACFAAVDSDPAFADLYRHVPLNDVRQASLAQQTDPSFATPHEIELLSERRGKQEACRKIVTNGLTAAPSP